MFNTENVLVATASLNNNVYKLNICENQSVCFRTVSSDVWHQRLGHVNDTYFQRTAKMVDGLEYKGDARIEGCEVCSQGKQSRLPFPKEGRRAQQLLEIIHSDLCGPMEVTSLGGAKYFIMFIDD